GYTGITRINAGAIAAADPQSFANLSGIVEFNGGTYHVTGNTLVPNTTNKKFATAFSGATSASTGTFDVDPNVTLTMGGANACMQTAGNGTGGSFFKTGDGTMIVTGNNGQLDVPFKFEKGTV